MVKMIKCSINGKEVEAPDGSTIIEAFHYNKIDIAHYCWHPGLSVAGVCRLCMVEVEGIPKMQIACNTLLRNGMVISNQTQQVKDTVKWGLDFHLINHPLDCPICDQSGECELQEQYMMFGQYDSKMNEFKVKKKKVVDLGERIVLDTERCILCSRCVRFTDEVTQTHEFRIFNRGDYSEIGTYENKPITQNHYSMNVVDICPVGALTSKDFRFKQRVWFLKDRPSICSGCSTGCNTKVFFNNKGIFRILPRFNKEINGHWMCDFGRDLYRFCNHEYRLFLAKKREPEGTLNLPVKEALSGLKVYLEQNSNKKKNKMALVLTGQYTLEEYQAVISGFKKKSTPIFHWVNNEETFDDFDGLLIRGDKNPNTNGLVQVLKENDIQTSWKELETQLSQGEIDVLFVCGPENLDAYSDLDQKLKLFSHASKVIWMTSVKHPSFDKENGPTDWIPTKSFVEKSGTFVNYEGKHQSFKSITQIVPQALDLVEIFSELGFFVQQSSVVEDKETKKTESFSVRNETFVKNEFTIEREKR